MTFTFQGNDYTLPDGLTDITVIRQQAWSLAYGHALNLRGTEIEKRTGGTDYQMKRSILFMDEITRALSFYSGIPLDDVITRIDMGDIVQLLAESQIAYAIQSTDLPLPGYRVPPPDNVVLNSQLFFVTSPLDAVELEDLQHNEFLIMLKMAGWLVQLTEGDWTNFHLICAALVRLPGEMISMDLINPAGTRAALMRQMDMRDGIGLAQLFMSQADQVLRVLDRYTTNQLLQVHLP